MPDRNSLYFWLGNQVDDDQDIIDALETHDGVMLITGNQFIDGPIVFTPEIDLEDPQSDE